MKEFPNFSIYIYKTVINLCHSTRVLNISNSASITSSQDRQNNY